MQSSVDRVKCQTLDTFLCSSGLIEHSCNEMVTVIGDG